MESNSELRKEMTVEELTSRIMLGGQLAVDRMLEKKRRENGFVVVARDGKVVKLNANDIPRPKA